MSEEAKEWQQNKKLVWSWEVGAETHFIYIGVTNVSFSTVQVSG